MSRRADDDSSPAAGSVPRTVVINREVRGGESVRVTALSDLHLESAACDVAGLRRLLEERAKLANHSAVIIGDVIDLVGNGDPRNRPHVQCRQIQGRDDWADQAIERAVEVLSVGGIVYDVIGQGNHEDEHLRRHGFDATSALAHRLRAARGGYSGVIDYRLHIRRSERATIARTTVRVLYHHGAWGGVLAKGYHGAMRWASQWDGWRVALYGHDHHSVHHSNTRVRIRQDGSLEEYVTHVVNCSSWTQPYADDARVTRYTERKGYTREPRLAPLLTFTPRFDDHHGRGLHVDVTVEM